MLEYHSQPLIYHIQYLVKMFAFPFMRHGRSVFFTLILLPSISFENPETVLRLDWWIFRDLRPGSSHDS